MSPVRSIYCVAPDPDRVFGEGLILGYGQIAASTTLIVLLIASATG